MDYRRILISYYHLTKYDYPMNLCAKYCIFLLLSATVILPLNPSQEADDFSRKYEKETVMEERSKFGNGFRVCFLYSIFFCSFFGLMMLIVLMMLDSKIREENCESCVWIMDWKIGFFIGDIWPIIDRGKKWAKSAILEPINRTRSSRGRISKNHRKCRRYFGIFTEGNFPIFPTSPARAQDTKSVQFFFFFSKKKHKMLFGNLIMICRQMLCFSAWLKNRGFRVREI